MVVVQSNGSRTAVEQQSNRSCNHRITHRLKAVMLSFGLGLGPMTTGLRLVGLGLGLGLEGQGIGLGQACQTRC